MKKQDKELELDIALTIQPIPLEEELLDSSSNSSSGSRDNDSEWFQGPADKTEQQVEEEEQALFDPDFFRTMQVISLIKSQIQEAPFDQTPNNSTFPDTIVLDMDETMLSAVCEFDPNFSSSARIPPDFTVESSCQNQYKIEVVLRPFLKECLRYFKDKGF